MASQATFPNFAAQLCQQRAPARDIACALPSIHRLTHACCIVPAARSVNPAVPPTPPTCRGHCPTIECCRYITGSEWLTGSADGSVSLWSSTKKKPLFTMRCDGGSLHHVAAYQRCVAGPTPAGRLCCSAAAAAESINHPNVACNHAPLCPFAHAGAGARTQTLRRTGRKPRGRAAWAATRRRGWAAWLCAAAATSW